MWSRTIINVAFEINEFAAFALDKYLYLQRLKYEKFSSTLITLIFAIEKIAKNDKFVILSAY